MPTKIAKKPINVVTVSTKASDLLSEIEKLEVQFNKIIEMAGNEEVSLVITEFQGNDEEGFQSDEIPLSAAGTYVFNGWKQVK